MSPLKTILIAAGLFGIIAQVAAVFLVPPELLDGVLAAGFVTVCVSVLLIEFMS